MTRNRFHGAAVAALATALTVGSMLFVTSSGAKAAPVAAGTVNLTIIFAPGTAKLSTAAKALLSAKVEQMQLAPSSSLIGYSSVATKKNKVASDSLARANAVKNYLIASGLTSAISTSNGGYSSRFLKPSVANRVVVSFVPTPGLIWVQDFNEPAGTPPKSSVFTGLTGNGCQELGLCNYGTGEIEFNQQSAAATDGKGNLVIHTSKQNGVFISERLWTAQKLAFQYGKLEIRAKMPVGSFNWPAIWMLGNNYQPPNQSFGNTQWPASGELDIAEGLARNSVVQGTLHGVDVGGGDWRGGAGLTGAAPLTDVSGDFHTWGINWQPNLVIFTMDGVEYARDTFDGTRVALQVGNSGPQIFDSHGNWPYNQPFFLILNNAIPAGTSAPDGTSSDFLIDWVHYSKFNGYGTLTR